MDNSTSTASTPSCLKTLKTSFASERKATASFAKGAFPSVQNDIGAYSTPSDAAAGFARGAAVLDGCKDVSFVADGKTVTGSIGAMSFPQIGAQSRAWALMLSTSGLNVGIDVVLILKGAQISEVVLGDLGTPSTDELTTFTQKAFVKLP